MSTIEWYTQGRVDDAAARAKRELRPLLVDLWSPGCRGCEWMEVCTYADAHVQALLLTEFICVKYDMQRADGDLPRLAGNTPVLWTPTLIVLDNGAEMRRTVGYVPPDELTAELDVALGLVALHQGALDDALERFQDVADRMPQPTVAPEALYWAGVAAYYREGRCQTALARWWREIGARYPRSAWYRRADVLQPPRLDASAA
jgi:hypothetical protein